VLRCLLFRFCAIPTGRCCPSYRAIREATGFCFSTISGALKRLETSGLVRIARRLIRTPHGARQITNAYAFRETALGARKPDYENSREITNLFKNIRRQPILPGLQPVPLPFNLRSIQKPLDHLKSTAPIQPRNRSRVP
jgi:DNA-binding transcriptional MocR family regulator